MRTSNRWSAVAAVIGVLVVGGAFLVIQRSQPAVVAGPSPTPSADPSPSLTGIVAPSLTTATAPTSSAFPRQEGLWIRTGTMGTPRSGHTAVRLLDGRVLVVAGSDAANDTSAELYDPGSGTWSATGNMVRPHVGLAATLLRDGRVLAIGEDANPEVYDPAGGTWTATVKMVWGDGETATQLRDGTVLVRGDGGSELYDPDTRTWTATASSSEQRHSHAAVLLPDGKVLVAGGHVSGDDPTDTAELYDPDTGSWIAAANMHAEREAIEAFLQPDGKVLVVGGSDRGDPQSVELYDPITDSWTMSGDVSRPGINVNASATLLSDGRVLVRSRGVDADLYDPGTESWTTAAPMLRSGGTQAILLLDGTVLVAGGNDCMEGVCVDTGASELYVPGGVSPPQLPAFPSPPPPVFPSPTPVPTPFPPQAGPIPPDARRWTVTVVNDSARPATLFVAAETEEGFAGPLVGTVTPNVVAAGAVVNVTFPFPRRRCGGRSS